MKRKQNNSNELLKIKIKEKNYNWRLSMPDKLIKKNAEVAEGKLEKAWGRGRSVQI